MLSQQPEHSDKNIRRVTFGVEFRLIALRESCARKSVADSTRIVFRFVSSSRSVMHQRNLNTVIASNNSNCFKLTYSDIACLLFCA